MSSINVDVINAILVLMVIRQMALADVLTRLVIIYLRGRRLTVSAPAPIAPIAGGIGA
jgi:hypothetical protein